MTDNAPLLAVRGLCVRYGAVVALRDVSLEIRPGETVAMLGANGAGKTSLLSAISGLVPASGGTVELDGLQILPLPPHRIVRAGIAHCPEGRRVFPQLTVAENLDMGSYTIREDSERRLRLERVHGYLPALAERRGQLAGTLSGGEQQMLAVGRALMCAPRILMLDEPSLGLAPLIVEQIFNIISRIREEEKVAIFLVEQNANEALLHSDRAYVLENGAIAMEGPAGELHNDPRVAEAYLGV